MRQIRPINTIVNKHVKLFYRIVSYCSQRILMCTGQRLLSTMNAWLLCLVFSVLLSGINGVMSQNGE